MNPLTKLTTTGADNAPVSRAELIQVLQWMAVIFAYAWWAVIIVYYGLLDHNVSVGYQFSSLSIVVVSLALVSILKLAMEQNKKLLIGLSTLGLFVSGLLA